MQRDRLWEALVRAGPSPRFAAWAPLVHEPLVAARAPLVRQGERSRNNKLARKYSKRVRIAAIFGKLAKNETKCPVFY